MHFLDWMKFERWEKNALCLYSHTKFLDHFGPFTCPEGGAIGWSQRADHTSVCGCCHYPGKGVSEEWVQFVASQEVDFHYFDLCLVFSIGSRKLSVCLNIVDLDGTERLETRVPNVLVTTVPNQHL